MTVELGTGYVTLVASAKGIAQSIAAELTAPLERASEESGDKAAAGFMDRFQGKAKALAGGAGIAIGGLLAKGFADSMNTEASNDKLAAQLGLPPERAAELGKVAGKIYAGNYGESVDQVNEALRATLSNGLISEDATNEQLQSITTKALNVSSAFGQDLGGTTAAVGQLIRTGLAKDADEAFDIITRGFQQGADKAGDLLDTYGEYGTQFRKLGLTGAQATGILSQGLKAGARDADIVADSLKEFSIRAIDGSKLTAEGFQALGLDASDMAARIGRGGADAAGGLQLTLDRLKGIEDPVARAAAATALFGTQAEDLGAALFAIDPKRATGALGEIAGAADQMGATLGDNAAGKLETFRRAVELKFASIASAIGPVLSIAPGVAGAFTIFGNLSGPINALGSAAKTAASGLISGVSAVGSFAASAAKSAISIGQQTAAFVAQKVAMLATAAAQKVVTAAQWLLNAAMSANPIFLVVAGIAALAAGFVLAYTKIKPFHDAVNAVAGAVKAFVTGAVDFLVDHWKLLLVILTGPLGVAVALVVGHFDTIKNAIAGAAQWVGDRIGEIVGFFTGLPGRIIGALGDIASLLIGKGIDLVTGLVNGYMSMVGTVTGFFSGLAGSVIGWIGDAATWLIDKGVDLITGLLNGIHNAEFALAGFIGGIAGKVIGWIGNAAGWLVGKGVETISGLISGLYQAESGLVRFFLELPGQIVSWIGGLGSTLLGAGEDLIKGLISGIGNMAKNAADAALDVVKGAVNAAKGFLGIRSPSKLFTTFGEQTVQGFVNGLEQSIPTIQRPLDKMSDLVNGTSFGLPNAGIPALVGGGAGLAVAGGMNVVVNAQTNADPYRISDEVTWAMRTSGR